jgi:hypothetical protein
MYTQFIGGWHYRTPGGRLLGAGDEKEGNKEEESMFDYYCRRTIGPKGRPPIKCMCR